MGHIFLTGFMGCGKSTVGRALSDITGFSLVDTDSLIEAKDGRGIPRIFKESGEGYFRRLETMVLRELQDKPAHIVSCGGGIVLREENVKIMKEIGHIVLLSATPETILSRVVYSDKRPLLEGKKNIKDISEMMEKRLPHYQAAADFTIPVDKGNPLTIAEEIIKIIPR